MIKCYDISDVKKTIDLKCSLDTYGNLYFEHTIDEKTLIYQIEIDKKEQPYFDKRDYVEMPNREDAFIGPSLSLAKRLARDCTSDEDLDDTSLDYFTFYSDGMIKIQDRKLEIPDVDMDDTAIYQAILYENGNLCAKSFYTGTTPYKLVVNEKEIICITPDCKKSYIPIISTETNDISVLDVATFREKYFSIGEIKID
jgi:hypothetical protein